MIFQLKHSGFIKIKENKNFPLMM